jgi:hypothetical protein
MMRIASAFLLVVASSCCFPYRGYEGDGTFHDSCASAWNGRTRYEVDFGAVDLTKVSQHSFRFAKLPPAQRWIIGFEVVPLRNRPAAEKLDDAELSILVTNERGEVVISEVQPISRWAWQRSAVDDQGVGPSFVYLGGKSRDIPIDSRGDVRVEAVGAKPDGGWGTYFKPRAEARYQLVLTVKKPDVSARYFVVRAVVEGSNSMGSL